MELSGDSDTDLHGELDDLQEYEEDENSLEIESIHGSSDDGIDELVIAPNGQLSVMKPSKKAAKPKKVSALAASTIQKSSVPDNEYSRNRQVW